MIRLYINQSLGTSFNLTLTVDQSHYLITVLRCRVGDIIKVFNDKDGEYNLKLTEQTKKNISGVLLEQTRSFEYLPTLKLIFAPIKQVDWIIEKATELGVTHFQPVITDHCHVRKLNVERLKRISIEASEQSERLCIPEFLPLISLRELDFSEKIAFAYERLKDDTKIGSCSAVIVGPEGGFSTSEVLFLKQKCLPISLGKTILRAETAAIVALDRLRQCV